MASKSDEVLVSAPVQKPTLVSLNEFCSRLSETVARPELIGAFAFSERATSISRDTVAAFQARYTAFINKPV